MTRFEELCQTYKNSRNAFIKHRDETQEFARILIGGLIQDLGIPAKETKFAKTTDDADDNQTYSIYSAMTLEKDGWWSIGLEFRIYEGPQVFPQQPVLIRFDFKKNDNNYNVKFGVDSEAVINPSEAQSMEAFYKLVFEFLKQQFEWNANKFAEENKRRIGF